MALAEVCDAWEEGRHEMTAAWLVERLPAKYTGEGKTRKARANLDQLFRKELVDKLLSVAGMHGGTCIGPGGQTLGR